MPLFKGTSSLSTPDKAIAYITDKNKAAIVSVRNLFDDEDYAKQFKDTMNRFGKGKKREERKYYHFKLSCAQKDNVNIEHAQLYAVELSARLFQDCECVIATHNDTKTIHSHIIVNAVNPLTGKKLRFNNLQYANMKDEANRLGEEMGFTPTEFRTKAVIKRTVQENHIILKGGTSWKEDLREVIEEAKLKATTKEEFIKHLLLYNVKIARSNTEYSYLHPQKERPIRGKRLGENYSKEAIDNAITENGHRRNSSTVNRVARTEYITGRANRQRTTERSVDDIKREMQRISKRAKQASQGNSDRDVIIRDESALQNERSDITNASGNNKEQTSKSGDKTDVKRRDNDFSK